MNWTSDQHFQTLSLTSENRMAPDSDLISNVKRLKLWCEAGFYTLHHDTSVCVPAKPPTVTSTTFLSFSFPSFLPVLLWMSSGAEEKWIKHQSVCQRTRCVCETERRKPAGKVQSQVKALSRGVWTRIAWVWPLSCSLLYPSFNKRFLLFHSHCLHLLFQLGRTN